MVCSVRGLAFTALLHCADATLWGVAGRSCWGCSVEALASICTTPQDGGTLNQTGWLALLHALSLGAVHQRTGLLTLAKAVQKSAVGFGPQ